MGKLITDCIDAIATIDKNNGQPSYNIEGDYYYLIHHYKMLDL